MLRKSIHYISLMLLVGFYHCPTFALINIVAAENIYGDVAKQIGGPYVEVISIIHSPNQDPHLFTLNPSNAKSAANADVLVYNGLHYDDWMQSLVAIKGKPERKVIVAANLLRYPSRNPHIWYVPDNMDRYALVVYKTLSQLDPAHHQYFSNQLSSFMRDNRAITTKLQIMKLHFQHIPITATEPIFGLMSDLIGFDMYDKDFQISMMNDVPPSIEQIKGIEDNLRQHKVRVLIFNDQVINTLAKRMVDIAHEAKIPVVGMSETLPIGLTYQQWMLKQLNALDAALTKPDGNDHAER